MRAYPDSRELWALPACNPTGNLEITLGGELQAGGRLTLIAERFGDDKNRPYWQTGVRFAVIPNLFQVDATTGQQFGGDSASRWISFGLRWTPDSLF